MKKRILSLLLAINMCFSLIPMTVFAAPEMAPVQNTASESEMLGGEEDDNVAQTAATKFSGGSGTAESPYRINTLDDLVTLANDVNGGTSYKDTFFKLIVSIDMSGTYSAEQNKSWTPIGTAEHPFEGNFDGNGNEVKFIYINTDNSKYVGLFGYAGENSVIKNLGVSGKITINVTSSNNNAQYGWYVGGIAGYSLGDIHESYNTCDVKGEVYVGGIVGLYPKSYNTLTNCYNTGTVSGDQKIGGIAGMLDMNRTGTVSNCYNIGTVTATRSSMANAIAYNSKVSDSYYLEESSNGGSGMTSISAEQFKSQSTFSSNWDFSKVWSMGQDKPFLRKAREKGIAEYPYTISSVFELLSFADNVNRKGCNYAGKYIKLTKDIDLGTLDDDYSFTPIGTEANPFQGNFNGNGHTIKNFQINKVTKYSGLFGYAGEKSVIKNLGLTGSVVNGGTDDATNTNTWYTGGIAGYSSGTITECYNACTVSGGLYVGGIVGWYDGTTLHNCYNIGNISALKEVAGIAGHTSGNTGVSYCYNTGTITSTNGERADPIACNTTNRNKVNKSYYLEGSSNNLFVSTMNTSVTSDDFKKQATFGNLDFDNIWIMGKKRPLLRNALEEGSEYNPYKISKVEELEALATKVNNKISCDGEYYILTANIDLSTKYNSDTKVSWRPIGSGDGEYTAFNGTFDGDGHTISGLYIASGTYSNTGLFGCVRYATIKNLTVNGSVFTQYAAYSGGIAGKATDSTFENCRNEAEVKSIGSNTRENGGGGIVGGGRYTTVKNCVNTGNITVNGHAGGVIGYFDYYSNVENCYNTGAVKTTISGAGSDVGGSAGGVAGTIIPAYNGTVKNCYNYGTVTVSNPNDGAPSGGFAGACSLEKAGAVANVYYLKGCEGTNTTFTEETYGKEMTVGQFESGEVAWLLQDAQTNTDDDGNVIQVWGQNLGTETYPVLTNSSDKKVKKISFLTKSTSLTNPYAKAYANNKLAADKFPNVPENDKYTFKKWGLSDSIYATEFTSDTAVTADMPVYGIVNEKTKDNAATQTVKAKKNSQITIDLRDYVENAYSTDSTDYFNFRYAGDDMPFVFKIYNENTLSFTPTEVGKYTATFNIYNNNLSLMSVENEVLVLTLDVGLEGEGTEDEPYLISNLEELEYFRDDVNGGSRYKDEYVKLTADINMSSKYSKNKSSWEPIGNYENSFNGFFDGNENKITGLYILASEIENSSVVSYGLFGAIGGKATIKKLYVEGEVHADKTNDIYGVAGIVGYVKNGDEYTNYCIENCESAVSVEAARNSTYSFYTGYTSYAGGIVGGQGKYANVKIKNCKNTGSIKGAGSYVGGIVSYVNDRSTVENCINTGSVTCTLDVNDESIARTIEKEEHKQLRVGGVVGCFLGLTFRSSYNTGTITVPSGGKNVGAVVGYSEGRMDSLIYLKGCNGTNTVFDSTFGTEMSSAQFESGEVAWLLQKGQTEVGSGGKVVQVWGQLLKGSNKDALPVLSDASTKTVYQVTFVNDSESYNEDNTYGILTRKYINRGESFGTDLPTGTSTSEYDFEHWSYGKKLEEKFEANTVVDSDKVVYAVGSEKAVQVEGKSYMITGKKGETLTEVNVYDYITNDTEKTPNFTVTLADGETLPEGLTFADGKITGTPEKAVLKDVKFDVKSGNLILFGGVDDSGTSFTLTFNVGLKGNGTKDDPYLIENLTDLEYLRDATNAGTDYLVTEGKIFKQTANIVLSNSSDDIQWTPIGSSRNPFKGTFNGNDKKIEGLYYVVVGKNYQGLFNGKGLFGYVTGGTVENLSVYGEISCEGNYIGGIVGKLTDGTIRNCTSECKIVGRTSIGGIVGITLNECTVEACTNFGDVLARKDVDKNGGSSAGGIVGHASELTKIKNCRNLGNVTALTDNAGGIVGYATTGESTSTEISNCYSAGSNIISPTGVGGIVGNDTATGVINCYYLTEESSSNGTSTSYYTNLKGKRQTLAQFKSGEVAWLLQNGNSGSSAQVWGQHLTNTSETATSNQDTYPVLTSDTDKKVNKLTFLKKNTGETAETYETHAVKYANKRLGYYDIPCGLISDNYTFKNWSQTESETGAAFDDTVEITSDKTLYAVGYERTEEASNAESYSVKLKKNVKMTDIDLNDYVSNKSGAANNFTFSVRSDSLPKNVAFSGSAISGTPATAGYYSVYVYYINNSISLMSLPYEVPTSESLTLMDDDNDGGFYILLDVELKGSGTETDPYLIEDLYDLEYFRDRVNRNLTGDTFKIAFFKLTDDIDMSENYGHFPAESIDFYNYWEPISCFEGVFDGNDHKISGLYTNEGAVGGGLFGENDGTIKKLGVSGTHVQGKGYVGGIAAINEGIIEHCYSDCAVTVYAQNGNAYAGGIVGLNGTRGISGKVVNCYNTGSVSGDTSAGIVGKNETADIDSLVENCYNIGNAVNGIVAEGSTVNVENNYYLDSASTSDSSESGKYEKKTAAEFASGEVAWLLQNGQTDESVQVWGQHLTNTLTEEGKTNKDAYPVFTSEENKRVYRVALMANDAYDAGDDYVINGAAYGNNGDTVTLPGYTNNDTDDYGKYFFGWATAKDNATAVVNNYTVTGETELYSIWNKVTFDVGGTNHTYLADNEKKITVTPLINGAADATKLTAADFVIKYYKVSENTGKFESREPVAKAVEIGKYLYVISYVEPKDSREKDYRYVGKNSFVDKIEFFSGYENGYVMKFDDVSDVADKAYENIGFMYIKSGAETAQQPVFFDDLAVNTTMTGTVTNAFHNDNAGSTTKFRSTNTAVATVGETDGKVTIKGVGSTVIIATSSRENSSDVYASYTLNVTKEVVAVTAENQSLTYGTEFSTISNAYTLSNEAAADEITGTAVFTTDYNPQNGVGKYEINVSGLESEKYELEFKSGTLTVGKKTLTAEDFTVTTEGRAYDGTMAANVNAAVKEESLMAGDIVTVLASGSFNEAAAGERTVSYSVTGLSGKDSSNYVLSDAITGTIENVVITKAIVTVSVPKTTTYVYDSDAKSVNAIGYAGGMYFDSFKVKYQKYNEDKTALVGEKLDEVTEVGEYKVFVEVTDSNYMLSEADADVIDATLKIKSAQQDYFTIEGISDTVTYGDTIELQTAGAIEGGKIEYTLTEGANIARFDKEIPNKLIITGTGKVTVTATSTKKNYESKTASRSFTVSQKTVTVTATAESRPYNGTKNVVVELSLDGVLDADKENVAVGCTSATVATADVENDKTVFVNGISISGAKARNYRLMSSTLQTSVNITKRKITGAEIGVSNKVYDGTTEVTSYNVKGLTGVIDDDREFVTLTVNAKFEDANVGEGKKVTFSNYDLSGVKSGNYVIEFEKSWEPTNTASITKATVSLEFGTLSYVYDAEKTRTVLIKATANGKSFDKFTVTYAGAASQKNVGRYEIEIALNEEIAGNYTLDYSEAKYLEIVKADQTEMTITGLPGTVSYGKTFTLQAVGGRSDITTEWSSTNETLAKVDDYGNVTITGATGDAVTITATKAATSNYTEQKASITFVPTKQAATFKITNLKQTYDGSEKPVTIETNAFELVDDGTTRINYYTETYSVEDGEALTGAPINAGTYYVTVTATGNYEGEQHATLIVEKAENPNKYDILISENIVYGDEYSVTPVKVMGDEYVPLEVGSITYKGASLAGEQTEKPKNAGTYFAILTVSDANYETVTVEKEFTIGKRTLTATVDEGLTRAYGEPDEEIIVKLSGFAYGENENVVLMKPTAKAKANVYSIPGTYDIEISGGYDENYDFAYDTTKKLTVTKLEGGYFRIVGGNPSPYVGNMFDLTAYVNDWTADVTWESWNTAVATVDENGRVTVIDEGTAKIVAKMNDVRFKADEPAEFTLVAVRLPEIQKNIYFAENLVEKNVGDEKFTNTLSEASEGATVKYTSGNTNVATVDENTGLVTIVGPGRTTIKASAEKFNCETVYAQYTLVVSKVHFTIKADDMTITYGEAFDETEASVNEGATLDGNFEGELKYRTSYRTGKNAGEYDIVPYGVTSKIYDVEFVAGTLTVDKKVLGAGDFKVEVSDKVYDGERDAKIKAEVKSSEIVGSDKLNVAVNGSFDSSESGTKSVTYSITGLSGVGYENYVLENTSELTAEAENGITKCPVEFFVSERTERIYDGKAQSVEITATANGKYFDKKNYTVYYTPKEGGATVTEPVNIGTYIVSVALDENDFNKNYEANDIDAVLVIGLDIEDRLTITGTKKNVTVGDEIRLYAHYGNRVAEVEWNIKNGAEFAEIDNVTGELKIKAEGTVTIIAKMTDPNYDGIEAEITLEAAKKKITLAVLPDELTKTYNGEEQYVKFTSEDVELYDENDEIEIDVFYVKDGKTTSYVKDAGTYTVYYKVNDKRYEREGNLTVKVEKAVVTVNAKDIKKEYGEEPVYELEVSDNVKGVDESTMLELVEFESAGAPKTANVGTYDIEVTLKKTTDDNCIYVVDEENNGKLEVTKATLTVNVDDVTREYGKENPKEIGYTVSGFKNDDEKTVKVTVTPKYLEDKFEETVGTHTDAVEALVTSDSGNYVIEIVYKEGNAADLIITKIPVKANAVTAKTSALTVKLDKIISGLGKDNFKVTDGENNPVELREVTVANDGKTYTLKGSFKAGTVYTVTPTLEGTEADEIYEIVSDPLTMKVSKSTGGAGGGGAGSSGTAVTYTVKFETNGAKAIEDVKVAKNAKVERPADPEREGFEFAGWFADEKLESEYDFDAKVTENITLYAKWTEKKDEADNKDDTENKEPTLTPKTFDDVKNDDWFKDDVDYVSSRGIMNGVSDNSFDPVGKVTRGMMVTILYRLEDEPTVEGECPFKDVEDGKYYANAVLWCYQNGIVKGISDTEYAPNDYVTREQMAAILYRYAQYKEYDVTRGGMRIREFADYEDISEYALVALTWAVNTELVNGKDGNKIAPADTASRAEIAAVLHRFVEAYSISD